MVEDVEFNKTRGYLGLLCAFSFRLLLRRAYARLRKKSQNSLNTNSIKEREKKRAVGYTVGLREQEKGKMFFCLLAREALTLTRQRSGKVKCTVIVDASEAREGRV